jgi:hypothetical protein
VGLLLIRLARPNAKRHIPPLLSWLAVEVAHGSRKPLSADFCRCHNGSGEPSRINFLRLQKALRESGRQGSVSLRVVRLQSAIRSAQMLPFPNLRA